MENGENPDLFPSDLIDDHERKPSHDSSPGMSMDDRIHVRATHDAVKGFLNTEHEFRVKSLALSLVPPDRLLKLDVRLGVEPDTHQALIETS